MKWDKETILLKLCTVTRYPAFGFVARRYHATHTLKIPMGLKWKEEEVYLKSNRGLSSWVWIPATNQAGKEKLVYLRHTTTSYDDIKTPNSTMSNDQRHLMRYFNTLLSWRDLDTQYTLTPRF